MRSNNNGNEIPSTSKVIVPETVSVGKSIQIYNAYPVNAIDGGGEFDEFLHSDNSDDSVQQWSADELHEGGES